MRVVILSDIHANREAFEAVLAAARPLGADLTVLLGDLVGYGPDPAYAVETAAQMTEEGALCIMGNHDEAAFTSGAGMSENARVAIEWTQGVLDPAHRAFLESLPRTAACEDLLFVHASAARPEKWTYLRDSDDAARCLAATGARHVFCGHTHVPAHHFALPGRPPRLFTPIDNKPVPLSRVQRFVTVVGSVGQPRDGNPAACFGLLDTDENTVTMVRVPYDPEKTLTKIKERGLPAWLGMRLKIGR